MRLKAVVLAAGAGRRFGGCKLTAPMNGQPLMAGALDVALASAQQVVLVTGLHAHAVEACARALQPHALADGRLRFVRAPNAAEGMGASLSAGMAEIGDADAVFVFLADMPAVPKALPPMLANRLMQGQGAEAAAPVWRGRRGHPVLFSRALFPALRESRADEGARALVAELGPRLALIDAPDDAILLDVDTVVDLQRFEPPQGGAYRPARRRSSGSPSTPTPPSRLDGSA